MNNVIFYMLAIAFYTILLLLWGKNGFKKTNTIRDFCVAGNSLGLTTSMFTFTATWFSAVSMQSVTGSVFSYGYATILYSVVGWFMGASFLVFAANRIRRYDIMTIPEFFKLRYNSDSLQILGGLVIVICYILYIIIQITGFGVVVSELLEINYQLAIVLIYLFVVYTSFGGLFSVSKTDMLNFVIVLSGILTAAYFIVHDIGSVTAMHLKAAEISSGALLDLSSNNLFSPVMIFTTSLAWGLGTAANPQYLIRILSARTKKTGMDMIGYSIMIMGVLYLGLMIIGIGSRVLSDASVSTLSVNEALPYIIKHVIHTPFGGLIFISVIASAISTANSQLLLVSSSYTYDIYKKIFNPAVSDERFITVARIVIFISGTISLLLAVNPPESLLLFGSYVWGILAVAFMLPLYGGLYWKRATAPGAFWSSVAGILAMGIFYLIGLGDNPLHVVHPVLPGLIVSTVVFYSVSISTPRPVTESTADHRSLL